MTTEPTNAEIATELRRELSYRERVYPRWVQEGRLDHAVANRRNAALHAAVRHFSALAEADRAKGRLL